MAGDVLAEGLEILLGDLPGYNLQRLDLKHEPPAGIGADQDLEFRHAHPVLQHSLPTTEDGLLFVDERIE